MGRGGSSQEAMGRRRSSSHGGEPERHSRRLIAPHAGTAWKNGKGLEDRDCAEGRGHNSYALSSIPVIV